MYVNARYCMCTFMQRRDGVTRSGWWYGCVGVVISAFWAPFFMCSAADVEIIDEVAEVELREGSVQYQTAEIDASAHEALILQFSYDTETADANDVVEYGWKMGTTGTFTKLGEFRGKNESGATPSTTDERGDVTAGLPVAAEVENLVIEIRDSDSGLSSDDVVRITGLAIVGTKKPVEPTEPDEEAATTTEGTSHEAVGTTTATSTEAVASTTPPADSEEETDTSEEILVEEEEVKVSSRTSGTRVSWWSDRQQRDNGTASPQVLGTSVSRFMVDMFYGMRHSDVMVLQDYLRTLGYFTFPQSTGYFGPYTLAAVRAFQADQGIVPAVGFVGPQTRERLNAVQSHPAGGE